MRKALLKINSDGRVIGADSNPECIGRYFVDDFWQMPPIARLDSELVVRYCKANGIRSIIPTRDGELLFFAENRDLLIRNGIVVMISSRESVLTCLDKRKFYTALKNKNGLNPISTFDHPDLNCGKRWVVKERFGSGSRNIMLNVSVEATRSSLNRFENPIYQPFIEGQEYSVDLYISLNAVPKGCVVRTRDLVIHGESQVTTTVERPDIAVTCLEAAVLIGLTGHALFQIVEDQHGSLNILECNCRFGGASSLSIAAGLDSFYWFFRECTGDDLSEVPFVKSRHRLRQIRYAEDIIIQEN